jgi:hypothetical protein
MLFVRVRTCILGLSGSEKPQTAATSDGVFASEESASLAGQKACNFDVLRNSRIDVEAFPWFVHTWVL